MDKKLNYLLVVLLIPYLVVILLKGLDIVTGERCYTKQDIIEASEPMYKERSDKHFWQREYAKALVREAHVLDSVNKANHYIPELDGN